MKRLLEKSRAVLPLAGALAVYKLFLLALAFCSLYLLNGCYNAPNYFHNFHWPLAAPPSLATAFKTWDAQHYLYLARYGYSAHSVSINFFPLWPWIISLGAWLLGGRFLLSGLVFSNIFSWAAFILFYAYALKSRGEDAAECALLLLLAYPGSLFFSFAYSESLFFILAIGLFWTLREKRWGWAAAVSFLLVLARPQGILAAPAYWFALWRSRKKLGPRAALMACAPLLGAAAYLAFMRATTGDAFSGFAVYDKLYFGASLWRVFDLAHLARAFVTVTASHSIFGSPLDRFWFLVFLCALPWLWKGDRSEFLYALFLGYVPAAGLSFVSYTRHMTLVLPLFWLLGEALSPLSRKPLRWLVLGSLLAVQAVLVVMHVNNYWVG